LVKVLPIPSVSVWSARNKNLFTVLISYNVPKLRSAFFGVRDRSPIPVGARSRSTSKTQLFTWILSATSFEIFSRLFYSSIVPLHVASREIFEELSFLQKVAAFTRLCLLQCKSKLVHFVSRENFERLSFMRLFTLPSVCLCREISSTIIQQLEIESYSPSAICIDDHPNQLRNPLHYRVPPETSSNSTSALCLISTSASRKRSALGLLILLASGER
jgi:hypothetical protein